MNTEQFDLHVARLMKDPEEVMATITPAKMNLIHAAIGISGEAGELLDAVKKHVFYNKPLDVNNVIEELGDIEFYCSTLRQQIETSRDEILIANHQKLKHRYPEGYSDAAAIARADKE